MNEEASGFRAWSPGALNQALGFRPSRILVRSKEFTVAGFWILLHSTGFRPWRGAEGAHKRTPKASVVAEGDSPALCAGRLEKRTRYGSEIAQDGKGEVASVPLCTLSGI